MAAGEEIGAFSVGIRLDIQSLEARVGTVEGLLGRIATSIDSLDAKGKAAGGGWLTKASQLYLVEQAVKGVTIALDAIPAVLNRSIKLFDDTVGAAGRYAKTLEIQATMVGSSVRQTADLQDGLQAITGSADAASSVLLRLSRAVGAASGGQLRIPPKQAFAELGVALTDAAGRGKPFGALMDELETKFNRMPEGPRRTALALAIFGFQGGKLLEMFKELGSSGKTYQQSMDALGVSIDPGLLNAAAKLDTQLNILALQGQTTWRLLGAEAAPAFAPLIQQLIELRKQVIDWVKENKQGIEDVAATISTKVSAVVVALRQMMDEFRSSGITLEGTFTTAVNVAAQAVLSLAKAIVQMGEGYAVFKGTVAAAAALALSGPEAAAKAWGDATDASFTYYRSLDDGLAKAQAALDATTRHTAAFQHNRDALRLLRQDYEGYQDAIQGESRIGAHKAEDLEQMRRYVQALGEDYLRLSEDERRYYESRGLHAPTAEVPKPEVDTRGPPTPKYDQRAIEQATKAIEKATEAADKERAAILGGAQAKIAATVASKEFAAASDTERAALERALTLLDASTQLQTRLKTLADTAKSVAQAGYANQLKLEKEALQIQLDRAKAEGNVQEEARLTTAVKQAELDETLAKERATYTQLMELRQALSNADSAVQQIALRQLEAVGLAREADGAAELSEAGTRLDQLLALYGDYVHQREALDKQAAAAAGAAIADQKKDIIDLRDTFLSVVDDMNEGIILGTKKMSDVWKSAWQSLEKQAEKAILNTALDLSGINTKFSLTDFVKGLGGGGGGAAAAGGEAAGGAGGILGSIGSTVSGWFSRTPNPNAPGVSPAIAGPPAPGTAGTAAAGVGLFGGIANAFSGLFGGGAKAGAAMPETVGAMTVNAGSVTILGAGGVPGVPAAAAPGGEGGGAPPAPAAGGGGGEVAPEGKGGGEGVPGAGGATPGGEGGIGQAIAGMGSGIMQAVKGVGVTFTGVGKLLLQPLNLLPNLLEHGFMQSVKTFQQGTTESVQTIQKGTKQTVQGVGDTIGQAGQVIGNTLSTIGSMIGGKAGQVLNIIGMIISLLANLIVAVSAKVHVFGTGNAAGGYVNIGGRVDKPVGSMGADETGGYPTKVHAGEAIINPRATALLGGRDAAMKLNAGLIPSSLAKLMADGVRVQMPAMPDLGGAAASYFASDSRDQSINIHPGAITVQVPEGVNGEQFGRELIRGVISSFGR